jgi:gliding motility-associated-like protein
MMKGKSSFFRKSHQKIFGILKKIITSLLLANSLFFNTTNSVHAQLCSGSLGSPIVNITFGAGVGRGAALDPTSTTYIYDDAGKLDEGYYTIANNTTGLRDNAWHATGDHTGDNNGYMMIVNSSFGAGVFYTKIVSGLCPNTTYEFSAWLMNTMNFTSQNPNITFTVSTTAGSQSGTYSSGYIPVTSSPVWQQYGFFFNTGAETSVVIKIINNAPGAIPGNDLALDDITFRPCGPNLSATINGNNSVAVCEGMSTSIVLNADVSIGYTNPQYQWQINTGNGWQNIPGANSFTSNITVTTPSIGTINQYRLIVGEGSTSISCSVISNTVSLSVEALPVAAFTVSNIPCVSQAVEFSNNSTSSAYLFSRWDFGDGSSSSANSPTHIYDNTGVYFVSLIVSSQNSCIDTIDAPVALQVFPIPHSEFTASPVDTTIYAPEVTITDLSVGGTSCTMYWADNSFSGCTDSIHIYKKAGTYNIMQVVTNNYGCTDTSYFSIIKKPEFIIFIPNAFSPNGDGKNDVFKPEGIGALSYTMQIFNRWGEIVFESQNVDEGWDGYYKSDQVQEGVYVYRILLRDEKYLKYHEYNGIVSLIR